MKMMQTLLMMLLLAAPAIAQEPATYTRKYNGKTGLMSLNGSLKAGAPDAGKTFLLITGITFPECDGKGLPKKGFRETLQTIDDATTRQLQLLGIAVKAAGFTYNCNQRGYYYLSDTADVRTVLETFYRQNFPQYAWQVHMRPDAEWDVYQRYLYPAMTGNAPLPPLQ